MKRLFCIALICIMLCGMCSCGNSKNGTKQTEESVAAHETKIVNAVESIINNASKVYTADWETYQKLSDAETAYNELEEHLKERITNYDKLILAWKKYFYYDCSDSALERTKTSLKAQLNDPSSLQIHYMRVEIYYDTNKEKPVLASISLDYSAKNGFGGAVRSNWYSYYAVTKTENDNFIFSSISSYRDFNEKKEELGAILIHASDLDN